MEWGYYPTHDFSLPGELDCLFVLSDDSENDGEGDD